MQHSVSRAAGSRTAGSSSRVAAMRAFGPAAARAPLRSAADKPRRAVVAAADVDPDNASILVCGGGGVALSVTRRLKDMGSWVWMLQRKEDRRKDIEGMMAIVAKGDALNKDEVEKIFAGIEDVDAVVSTIGGSVADPTADSQGNINIIEAAVKKGVKKFVLVTSIGCGDSKDAPGEKVYEVLKPVLVEKDKAEAVLKSHADKMAYTIIRPGGLQSEPATGNGMLTADASACGAITREDTAAMVVKALFSSKTDNKVLSAVDKNKVSTPGPVEPFAV